MNWYKKANRDIDNYLISQVQQHTSGADTHTVNNLVSVYTTTVGVFKPSDEIVDEMERVLRIYVRQKGLGKIVDMPQLKQMMSNAAQQALKEAQARKTQGKI